MGNGENDYNDLMLAAAAFEGVNVHESAWSQALADSADWNSRRCASLEEGGHHNWDRRFRDLGGGIKGASFSEINAVSWKHQEKDNPVMLWTEAFKCWKKSKGHWQVASKKFSLFGAGLAKSKRGLWYMTIVVDTSDQPKPYVVIPMPEYRIY